MMKTLVNPSSTDSRKINVVSTKSTDKQLNASEYIGHCTYNLSCGNMPMLNIQLSFFLFSLKNRLLVRIATYFEKKFRSIHHLSRLKLSFSQAYNSKILHTRAINVTIDCIIYDLFSRKVLQQWDIT